MSAREAPPYDLAALMDALARAGIEVRASDDGIAVETRSRDEVDARLRESEHRFRQLAEAAPDTITVIADGRFVYANPAAVRLLGFDSMEEFCARPIAELLSPEETALMFQRMQQARAGVDLTPREYTARRKDGAEVTMEISSLPTEFEGRPAVVAHGRDTTERRRLQAELLQADRMATVGALVAGVAHEINNPLTYLLIHLERMQRDLPGLIAPADDSDRARRDTTRILSESLDAAQRVRDIVRELLTFARSDSAVTGAPLRGHGQGARVDGALETAVRLAHALLETSARVRRELDPTPPVAVTEARLVQVFLNLLINAAHAIAGDPRQDRAGEIWIKSFTDGERVVVEIADNGPGVAPAVLQQIFDPFFTTKAPGQGTGIGLAISRTIVEEMGGEIAALNGHQGGLLVRMILPTVSGEVAAVRAPLPPATPSPENAPRSQASILVVDDEPLVARVLAQVLTRAGFQVTSCVEPMAALELLRGDAPFDLVFCDINMPGASGADIYRSVLEDRPEYGGRFAFITGGAMSDRAAKIVAESNAPVVEKPFSTQTILELTRSMLQGA